VRARHLGDSVPSQWLCLGWTDDSTSHSAVSCILRNSSEKFLSKLKIFRSVGKHNRFSVREFVERCDKSGKAQRSGKTDSQMAKRTTITVETWQRTVIQRRQGRLVWCERCGSDTESLSVSQAALLSGTDEQEISRRAEEGELHFAASLNGQLMICGGGL
jgi:hypothetical protein